MDWSSQAMKFGAGAWAMFLAFHAFLLWAGLKLRSSGHPILGWILLIWFGWDMLAAGWVVATIVDKRTASTGPAS